MREALEMIWSVLYAMYCVAELIFLELFGKRR
jgi:hypothetical protein